MADQLTMLDVVKRSGNDTAIPLVEEAITAAPEFEQFPMRPIAGTTFTTAKRIALPDTQFVNPNGGSNLTASKLVQKRYETYHHQGVVGIAKSIATADERGVADVQAMEAIGVTERALQNIGKQVYNGTDVDGNGFPGLKSLTPPDLATTKGDALALDAGGTTADTASSVYFIKFGEQHCQLIGGMNQVVALGDWYEQLLDDPEDSTKKVPSFVADLAAWVGLAVYSDDAVRRIANLTEDSGKGWTDALSAEVMSNFPAGVRPDVIMASRRSIRQLQSSRAALVALNTRGKRGDMGGSSAYAPYPTDFEGIPIIPTDSIPNTDAIESFS